MVPGLVAALRFLTRIPVPGRESRMEDVARGVAWFPLVGVLVGLATAGAFVLGLRVWPPALAAALAVALGLLATGGFHEDGAADAADGLGGGWSRERVLEIMKDSRIGAYGAMALWAALTVRWGALCALDRRALWALPLAMAWGRWSIVALMAALPPASAGLAREVGAGAGWKAFLGATFLLVLAHLAVFRQPGVLRAAMSALGALLAWGAYLRHRMKGHTGDLLGAGNQLVETAALLALAVR